MERLGIFPDSPVGATDTVADPPRIAVLVVGMHRSGTSATTRVLNLLGYALPATLLQSAKDNPRGHWESAAVMHFNDELLAAVGSSWHDWIPHDTGSADVLHEASFVARGRSLMCEEFGNAARLVLKDPRLCRVMPTWLKILAAEAIEPKIVLPIRNPLAVAQSLAHRNDFDEMSGMLLWLRNVLDAENATRGQSRAFANYEDLLRDWRSVVARIGNWTGLEWPDLTDPVAQEIDAFLTVDLKHHVGADALVSMPSWVSQIYAIIQRWARDGEDPADHAQIDAISHGFRNSAENFVPMMSAMADIYGRLQRETAAGAATRAHGEAIRDERNAIASSLVQMTADRDLLRTDIGNLESNLAAREAELAAERAKRIAILSANTALVNRCKTQAHEMAMLVEAHADKMRQINAELDRLRTEAALARSKATSSIDKVERQTRNIADLKHKLDEAYSSLDWLSRIGVAIAEFPRWWSLLPPTIARRWQERRLHDDGLFDAVRYRADHPADVEAHSAPLRHHLLQYVAERQGDKSRSP